MISKRFFTFGLIITTVLTFLFSGNVQAAGTDEIRNYIISIDPQDDGSLINTYTIDWCVISNDAGPLEWFYLGLPNEHYELLEYSGDARSIRSEDSNFNYRLRIDLKQQANAGDCVNVAVSVRQYDLAYAEETAQEISYQFISGWFDEIPVLNFQLIWKLPTDTTLLKSFDPLPTEQDSEQATWKASLEPGEKFTVNVTYDLAAFPGFYISSAQNPSQGSETSTSSDSYETNPQSGIILPTTLSFCACIPMIVFLIILVIVLSILTSIKRAYQRGGYFGGYREEDRPSSGGWIVPIPHRRNSSDYSSTRRSGGSAARPSTRSGGGSGQFGGRGSSCACVSSGCACACAGSGRAGCSRKGFDVSGLFIDRHHEENT